MVKKKFDPFRNMKLDQGEQELYDSVERGEWKEVDNVESEKKRYVQIFREAAKAEKKEARLNIRLKRSDLDTIRKKAAENGLAYQTLISILLHHFATGKIKLRI